MARTQTQKRCEGERFLKSPETGKYGRVPCTELATKTRKNDSFQVKFNGQPKTLHYCAECVANYDEYKAELAAEARMS